jgi:hypothetical protein
MRCNRASPGRFLREWLGSPVFARAVSRGVSAGGRLNGLKRRLKQRALGDRFNPEKG